MKTLFFLLVLLSTQSYADCWSDAGPTNDYYENKKYSVTNPKFQGMEFNSLKEVRALACQNNARAQLILGYEYYIGTNVDKDIKTAINWLKKAITNGSLEAHFHLGQIYSDASESFYDLLKAVSHFEEAVKDSSMSSIALFHLGLIYQLNAIESDGIATAMQYFNRSSDLGYISASYNLALIYQNNTTYKDIRKAIVFYELSIAGGHKRALHNLATIFLTENGHTNFELAYQLFKKSFDGGNHYSAYYLGVMYDKGIFVGKDESKAKYFLTYAKNNGVDAAAKALADIQSREY